LFPLFHTILRFPPRLLKADATIFWTCIKITKALKDFHGEE